MARPSQIDWAPIKQDYCVNIHQSVRELAEKFDVSVYALRHQIDRGKWAVARESYTQAYQQKLQELAIQDDAPAILKKLNTRILAQNEELRQMLNTLLKVRADDGRVILRPGITIMDVRMAIAGFAELQRMDRLALGASTDNVMTATTTTRYDQMSEEQLLEELKQVRSRVTITLPGDISGDIEEEAPG